MLQKALKGNIFGGGQDMIDGKNIRGVIKFLRIGLVNRSLPWGA